MNPYSSIHNYADPDYSPDFQFINAALSFKQERLDTNRAKLQNLYDQFSVLQVKKGVDQKYIEDRLKQVRDITNKYASMDLSDPNFAASLMTNTGQILDDKVKTAILSTKMIAAEDTYWRDMEKNKPDMYSKLNHQYALSKSDRQRYLTTTETGDAYRGGADFIEYRDLSKKLMENIPKLQTALKAKWIEQGPGQGYFQSIDTYEAIPPADMQRALQNMFDEKDMQQIGINAWGQYDRMSDEDLKASYESHFNPRIEQEQERLQALQVAYNTAGNSKDKEMYQNMINQSSDNLKNMSSYSYDSVTKSLGREAAYQTLHKSKYFADITETYSYEKRLIDRKVDDVQKANLEYQLKLDEFELSREKAIEDARHNMVMEQKGSKTGKNGEVGADGVFVGQGVPIDPAEQKDDYIYAHFEDREKAYNEVVGTLKTVIPNISDDVLKSALRDPAFRGDLKNLANKSSIQIAGKTVKLTPEMKLVLDQYRTKVVDRSAVDKEMYKDIETTIGQINSQLKKTAAFGSPDMDINGLPNFNFRLEKGNDGKYKYKFIEPGKGAHNYAYLAKNGAKNESEDVTQKVYTALHLYRDPNISNAKKKITKDYIYNELLPQLDKNGRDAVNKAMSGLRNVTTTKMGVKDYWLTEFTSGDTEAGANPYEQGSNIGLGIVAGVMRYGNNQPAIAAAIEGKITPNDMQGLNTIINNSFDYIGEKLNSVYTSNRKLAENAPIHFDNTFAEYEQLKRLGGIGTADYKDDVILKVRFENGEPTNQVDVFTYVKNKSNKVLQQTGSTTTQDLEKKGIAVFDTKRYNTYDARVQEYANVIPLGNMDWDANKRESYNYQATGNHSLNFQDDSPSFINYIDQVVRTNGEGVAKELIQVVDDYIGGKYTFDIEPSASGAYKVSMKENGKEIHYVPTDQQVLTDDYVKSAYEDPRPLTEEAVRTYLEKLRTDKTRLNNR